MSQTKASGKTLLWLLVFGCAFIIDGFNGIRFVLGVLLLVEVLRIPVFVVMRLRAVKKENAPTPMPWQIVASYFKVRWRKHKVKAKWAMIGRIHEGMHTPLIRAVPKVWQLRADINDDLVGVYYPNFYGLSVMAVESKTVEIAGTLQCAGGVETERFDDNLAGRCFIKFRWSTPLRRIVSLDELPASTDPMEVSIALKPGGTAVTVRIDQHMLVGGLPGQGKSNLIWAIINALLAMGHWVRVYVGDNKTGIELTRFAKYAGELYINNKKQVRLKAEDDGQFEMPPWMGRLQVMAYTMDDEDEDTEKMLLPRAVEDMKIRRRWMRGQGMEKLEVTTQENPLCLVVVDEVLSLQPSTFKPGGAIRKLGSGGRASLFTLLMNTQDARVEALPSGMRTLIGTRISFATDDVESTNAILGKNAEGKGARCSQLDRKRDKGVCFVGFEAGTGGGWAKVPLVTNAEKDRLQEGIPVMPRSAEVVVSKSAEARPFLVYVRHDYSPDFRRVFRGNVSYVGKTKREFKDRDAEHRLKDWKWCDLHNRMENHWKMHGDDSTTDIIRCKSEEAMNRLEEKLIRRYRPPFNDKLKPKGRSLRQLLLWDANGAPAEPDDGLDILEPVREPEKVSVAYDPEIDGIEGAE